MAVFMLLIGLIAFIFDARYYRIPNWLSICGVCVGMIGNYYLNGIKGCTISILGLIVGFIMMFAIYVFGAIGAGDVKLFSSIGAITGTYIVVQVALYSFVYAGIISLMILLYKGQLLYMMKKIWHVMWGLLVLNNKTVLHETNNDQNMKFPFMYAVFPAIVTVWFYNQWI